MVGGFSGGDVAVVATAAVFRDLGVIHTRREPAIAVVTAGAIGCGGYMVGALAGGGAAVVAANTVSGCVSMVEVCR